MNFNEGNKIYSPKTCCIVPREINTLFLKRESSRGDWPIGVYKKRKKFSACISSKIKNIGLGTFNTPDEAFQAYKVAKEKYIKQVADKWKGKIDERVYEAMYNYEVEITD